METFIWLAALLLFLVIEFLTMGLTTIWFAGGALLAFIGCLLGAGLIAQVIIFGVVSFLLLLFTRPIAVRCLNRKTAKTNADSVIGQVGTVEKAIDNLKGEGTVKVNGQIWTARTEEEELLERGTHVYVLRIEGVKLIVKKCSR